MALKRKTLIVAMVITAAMFAQKPKAKAPAVDPEERWACGPGTYHKCKCPIMVDRIQKENITRCMLFHPGEKENKECLAKLPTDCEIIQVVDTKDPTLSCKRSCSKARCRCLDEGMACFGPALPQPDQGDSFP